jgi:hypothetical protein
MSSGSLFFKAYVYKLRAYSGYICGLILAQLLASVLMLNGSNTFGTSDPFNSITLHTYTARIIMQFSVIWALIVAFTVSSYTSKNAAFSLPANRLTDCFSDFAYMLTGCLFGGVTTALFGAAFRIIVLLLHPGTLLVSGFYPAVPELCTVAAVTFFYMLLVSAVGYFAGTLLRISKIFIVLVASLGAVLLFSLNSLSDNATLTGLLQNYLFYRDSLASFALSALIVSAFFLALSTLICRRLEVK